MTIALTVDAERLWRHIMAMARIGATARGGSCRLALTEEDKAGLEVIQTLNDHQIETLAPL